MKSKVMIEARDGLVRERLRELLSHAEDIEIVEGAPADAVVVEASGLDRLSPREREVLALIALGNTNKAIAQQLGISAHTVNAHRVNLMAKLDLHDAQAVTRFALRNGLIPL